jgi:Zn-dependent protease with chaperone function
MPGAEATRPEAKSAGGRAVVALALWLGFYGLGFGLAALLFALPWAQLEYQNEIGLSGFLCAFGALTVLWAIFPGTQFFRPPSEALPPGAQTGVSALVRDLAVRVGHPEPEDIFLIHDANAFAGRRRLSWRKRPRSVVGIGLFLFDVLDRDELASVVAHELGHHCAGDVLLGPWVHRIRTAISRAVDRLEGSSFWLHLPFVAYAELFLRITVRTSREQELSADALAGRVCGPLATARALVRVHELGPLWEAYWLEEVMPVLMQGFRPPLLAGFRTLVAQPKVRAQIESTVAKFRDTKPSRTDTHPILEDRLVALGAAGARAPLGANALALLDDVDGAELCVIRGLLKDPSRPPELIAWSEVGEKVWLPFFSRTCSEHEVGLRGVSLAKLPDFAKNPGDIVERSRGGLALFSPEAERRRAMRVLHAWLCVELHKRGFRVETEPGAPIRLTRGKDSFEAESTIKSLADGRMSADEWSELCRKVQVEAPSRQAAAAPVSEV